MVGQAVRGAYKRLALAQKDLQAAKEDMEKARQEAKKAKDLQREREEREKWLRTGQSLLDRLDEVEQTQWETDEEREEWLRRLTDLKGELLKFKDVQPFVSNPAET